MRITYDTESDALTITLSREEVERTVDVGHGRFLDFDEEGNIVAIEILDASEGFELHDLCRDYPILPVLELLRDHVQTARDVLNGSPLREVLVG